MTERQTAPAGHSPQPPSENLKIVGIGASAGGLKAMQAFFNALPADMDMAFVVITHLDPERESLLDELLQTHITMPVRQVRSEESPIQPNHVYVIAPAQQLLITDTHLATRDFEEPRGRRMPIDTFFRSLASPRREVVAILLSGGGTDGTVGMKAIKELGGLLMVQDPDEAEHDSMPRSGIATGLVDVVAPVRDLAQKLVAMRQQPAQVPRDVDALTQAELDTISRILTQVRARTGYDFSHYKQATLLRRIGRRLQVTGAQTLDGYLAVLRHNTAEAVALFNDLLITVTSFFRDPEAWQTLAETVIPHLFAGKDQDDAVRVWSVGCATGEEAYSMAMVLLEHAATLAVAPKLQVFATDLDDNALLVAREGRYPAAIQLDVSPERLARFFVQEGDHYRVRHTLRDKVLFTNHSVLRDPPFAQVDLIVCRNLLIYLQRSMQAKVFEIFHYALRKGLGREPYREGAVAGFLFLGSAESPDAISELFQPLDKRARIYQPQAWPGEHPHVPTLPLLAPRSRLPARQPAAANATPTSPSEPPWQAWEDLAPPGILVDADLNAVYLSETAGRYLQPPGGRLTTNVVQLARPELQIALRSALFEAFEHNRTTVSGPLRVDFNGGRTVYLAVRPRPHPDGTRLALIVFLEDGELRAEAQSSGPSREGDPRDDRRHDQIFGYPEPAPNWGPEIFRAHILPEDREQFDERLGRALERGVLDLEVRVRWPDGSVHWIHDVGRVYYNGAGQPVRMAGITLDITGRKQTEEDLRLLTRTLEERVEERTHQIQELASQLTLAEQAERHRIAQVLHDDLQQHVYALQMQLAIVKDLMEAGQAGMALAELAETETMWTHILAITRRLSVDLSPPVLVDEGLVEALAWLVPQMHSQFGLTVVVEAEEALPTLDDALRVLLFQIVRELLFNIVKHAGAPRAVVTLTREQDILRIDVSDNGIGMDAEEALESEDASASQGLAMIRRRLHLFGGQMTIHAAPGHGTRITITAPLRRTNVASSVK